MQPSLMLSKIRRNFWCLNLKNLSKIVNTIAEHKGFLHSKIVRHTQKYINVHLYRCYKPRLQWTKCSLAVCILFRPQKEAVHVPCGACCGACPDGVKGGIILMFWKKTPAYNLKVKQLKLWPEDFVVQQKNYCFKPAP